MKKSIWKKPEFEVETFVPNNYIAACYITLEGGGPLTGYIWEDENGNGQLDFETFGTIDENGYIQGYEGEDFYWDRNYKQTLTRPDETITDARLLRKYKPVIFSPDGVNFTAYNAVSVDVAGEKEYIFFTQNDVHNNS